MQFKTAVVKQAHDYWLSKAAPGRLPARAEIELEEIKHLLPYVFLVDVAGNPTEFRFRLVGTEIDAWAGKPYTGLAVNERDYGPQWRRIYDEYLEVVRTRAPRFSRYRAPWVSKEYRLYERFIAPLSNSGGAVDMLFGALHMVD
ncbi:MAG: PAS domain-containing protein [Proteobacteria bacterium]|nr:PAS domain-containing protein [Pseudomonadota bacterium]